MVKLVKYIFYNNQITNSGGMVKICKKWGFKIKFKIL